MSTNGAVANRALELLGKQRGMFGDKLELAVTPEQAKGRVFEIFNAAAKQRDALCAAQTGSGNVNPAFKPSLRHVTG